MKPPPLGLRPAEPSDEALIFHSWCRSIRGHQPWNLMTADEFSIHHGAVLSPLLERAGALVAYEIDEHGVSYRDHVMGWICSELRNDYPILHFLFVKMPYRRLGIGTHLMEMAFEGVIGQQRIYVTHPTPVMHHHYRSRWGVWANPYLVDRKWSWTTPHQKK